MARYSIPLQQAITITGPMIQSGEQSVRVKNGKQGVAFLNVFKAPSQDATFRILTAASRNLGSAFWSVAGSVSTGTASGTTKSFPIKNLGEVVLWEAAGTIDEMTFSLTVYVSDTGPGPIGLQDAYDDGSGIVTSALGPVLVTHGPNAPDATAALHVRDQNANPGRIEALALFEDSTDGTGPLASFVKTSAAALGPELQLFHDSTSPAIGDSIARLSFYGRDAAGTKTQYAGLAASPFSVTDGVEIGRLSVYLQEGHVGGFTQALMFDITAGGGVVTNAKAAGSTPALRLRAVSNFSATQPVLFVENNNANLLPFAFYGQGDLECRSSVDSATGPELRLWHEDPSADLNDAVGLVSFWGQDSGGSKELYAQLKGVIQSPTATAEAGQLELHVKNGGVLRQALVVRSPSGSAQLRNSIAEGSTPAFQLVATSDFATANTVLSLDTKDGVQTPFLLRGGGDVVLRSYDPGPLGPALELYQDSASPAANDVVGRISFQGEDSIGTKTEYASISARILDPTEDSESSELSISLLPGSLQEVLNIRRSGSAAGVVLRNNSTTAAGVNSAVFRFDAVDDGGESDRILEVRDDVDGSADSLLVLRGTGWLHVGSGASTTNTANETASPPTGAILTAKRHSAYAGSDLKVTTGAAQTTAGGFTTIWSLTIPTNTTYLVEVHVQGREDAGGTDIGGGVFHAIAYRLGGGAVLQASQTDFSSSTNTWGWQFAVNSNDLQFQARGNTGGETVNWTFWVTYMKVGNSIS